MTGSRNAMLVAVSWMLAFSPLAAQPENPAAGSGGEKPLASIEGKVISAAEVEARAAQALRQVEEQRQAILQRTLDEMIAQRLVELEAQKRGLSVGDLLKAEVEPKVTPPSEADIDAFYNERKAEIGRPKEQVALQIREFLLRQRRSAAQVAYLQTLRGRYAVKNLLEDELRERELTRAAELRKLIEEESVPARGPATAPVTIVEFSDFECGYCRQFAPTLEKVLESYKDKVRLIYRQFPIASIHPRAVKAAEASFCAADQGKFWQLHDLMFAEQDRLAIPDLKEKAARLGLDQERFNRCLDDGSQAQRVQRDQEVGTRAGVADIGTPSVFVNGRLLKSGAGTYEELASLVDEELKRQAPAAGTR